MAGKLRGDRLDIFVIEYTLKGLPVKIEQTALPDVLIVTPDRFGDARGFFSESWSMRAFAAHGIDCEFVQDNHSMSAQKGTVRGLHYQRPPRAQDKLVRCGRGALLDVAVDFRKGSPDFGRWVAVELSFENGRQLLVPKGFLHGFVSLTDDTEIIYKCSDYYAPECDGAVRWDDPEIGIDWRLGEIAPVLSQKDTNAPYLAAIDSPFAY